MLRVIPVIMAGGSGSRLWPLSRTAFPKQFMPMLQDSETLLQSTIVRLSGLELSEPIVICNEEHRFLAAEQLRSIGYENIEILLEPVSRNTAPTIALAALKTIQENNHDAILLVLSADHHIPDTIGFGKSIHKAIALAQNDKLVTLGVVPEYAETGYGYIQRGDAIQGNSGFKVKRFIEKPSLEKAEEYLREECFYWNSGVFVFKASKYIESLQKYHPAILKACHTAIQQSKKDFTFTRIDKVPFQACPAESIDYAVMEKSQSVVVVPLDTEWYDLGAWSTLWKVGNKDEQGNVVNGDAYIHECSNSYVHSTSKLVVAIGIEKTIIVETSDAVLVCNIESTQSIKKLVEALISEGRKEVKEHKTVYRPWGYYDSIDFGRRYQVKRITVKPGGKLSSQLHHHRAEHWVVVSGTARVTNGEKKYLLTENQSSYIPIGQVHSLENPGNIPLEIIEIQSGSYLGEDDIVRLEDVYGRV